MADIKENFEKRFSLYFQIMKDLKILEGDKEVKSAIDIPLINGEIEVLFAIYFQNRLQPKNSQRRDAVTGGYYK